MEAAEHFVQPDGEPTATRHLRPVDDPGDYADPHSRIFRPDQPPAPTDNLIVSDHFREGPPDWAALAAWAEVMPSSGWATFEVTVAPGESRQVMLHRNDFLALCRDQAGQQALAAETPTGAVEWLSGRAA